MAILQGLLPWYPEQAALFHEGLALPLKRRLDLFRALVTRGLPDDVVRKCLADELLARGAYEVLRLRGADLTQGDLSVVAKLRAKDGYSVAGARAFAREEGPEDEWGRFTKVFRGLVGRVSARKLTYRKFPPLTDVRGACASRKATGGSRTWRRTSAADVPRATRTSGSGRASACSAWS